MAAGNAKKTSQMSFGFDETTSSGTAGKTKKKAAVKKTVVAEKKTVAKKTVVAEKKAVAKK